MNNQQRSRLVLSYSLLLLLGSHEALGHIKPVHQYLAIQGFELLKMKYPSLANSIMAQHIGTQSDDNCDGDPWTAASIATGARREDCEDPVYNYGTSFNITTTSTHLWDADAGDESKMTICTPICRNYENAYQKALRYIGGTGICTFGSLGRTVQSIIAIRMV